MKHSEVPVDEAHEASLLSIHGITAEDVACAVVLLVAAPTAYLGAFLLGP